MTFREVQIGPCRLINADSRDILPLDVERFHLVTDPPYGIGLRNGDVDGHRTDRSFNVIGDEDGAAGQAIIDWAELYNVPTIAFASPWKPWPGAWRNLIAWDKGGAVGGGGDVTTCLKRTWELIQTVRTGPLLNGRLESVVRFTMIGSDTADHICAKPVPLMKWLLEAFVPLSMVVYDPFMGRGSTLLAAIETGHEAIGIEVDPVHFKTACRLVGQAWNRKCSELPFEKPAPLRQLNLIGADE
jgi:site-specific DNA-methyltransferase (adenine-specific)